MLISSFLVCVIVVNIIQFGVFVLYFKEYLKLLGTVQVFVWVFFFFKWVGVGEGEHYSSIQRNRLYWHDMLCWQRKSQS